MAKATTLDILVELLNRADVVTTGKVGVLQVVLTDIKSTKPVVLTIDSATVKLIKELAHETDNSSNTSEAGHNHTAVNTGEEPY